MCVWMIYYLLYYMSIIILFYYILKNNIIYVFILYVFVCFYFVCFCMFLFCMFLYFVFCMFLYVFILYIYFLRKILVCKSVRFLYGNSYFSHHRMHFFICAFLQFSKLLSDFELFIKFNVLDIFSICF